MKNLFFIVVMLAVGCGRSFDLDKKIQVKLESSVTEKMGTAGALFIESSLRHAIQTLGSDLSTESTDNPTVTIEVSDTCSDNSGFTAGLKIVLCAKTVQAFKDVNVLYVDSVVMNKLGTVLGAGNASCEKGNKNIMCPNGPDIYQSNAGFHLDWSQDDIREICRAVRGGACASLK